MCLGSWYKIKWFIHVKNVDYSNKLLSRIVKQKYLNTSTISVNREWREISCQRN